MIALILILVFCIACLTLAAFAAGCVYGHQSAREARPVHLHRDYPGSPYYPGIWHRE